MNDNADDAEKQALFAKRRMLLAELRKLPGLMLRSFGEQDPQHANQNEPDNGNAPEGSQVIAHPTTCPR